MKKLEKHPFLLFVIILLLVVLISEFKDNSLATFAFAGLFLGAAGFVNSLWLNHRINKMQDALCEKNIVSLEDFSARDKKY